MLDVSHQLVLPSKIAIDDNTLQGASVEGEGCAGALDDATVGLHDVGLPVPTHPPKYDTCDGPVERVQHETHPTLKTTSPRNAAPTTGRDDDSKTAASQRAQPAGSGDKLKGRVLSVEAGGSATTRATKYHRRETIVLNPLYAHRHPVVSEVNKVIPRTPHFDEQANLYASAGARPRRIISPRACNNMMSTIPRTDKTLAASTLCVEQKDAATPTSKAAATQTIREEDATTDDTEKGSPFNGGSGKIGPRGIVITTGRSRTARSTRQVRRRKFILRITHRLGISGRCVKERHTLYL